MKNNLKLLLSGVVHPVLRLYREEFKQAELRPGLTFAQFRILNGIRRGRNQIGKLVDHHGISQPAMSKIVDALVRRGLVKRLPQAEDRRKIVLQLTPKAVTIVESVEQRVIERVARQVHKRSAREQQHIHEGLALISNVLMSEDL